MAECCSRRSFEQTRAKLGIVHFPERSKAELLQLVRSVKTAIGPDFFAGERYCEVWRRDSSRLGDAELTSTDQDVLGQTAEQRLIQFARQCLPGPGRAEKGGPGIVDCQSGQELKMALYPSTARFMSMMLAERVCESLLVRLALWLILLVDTGDEVSGSFLWGRSQEAELALSCVQIVCILGFFGLNLYRRQGNHKPIHWVETLLVAVAGAVFVWFVAGGPMLLRVVSPALLMCWSRTLRNLAGNSFTTFLHCIPMLLFLLMMVMVVGYGGMLLLALQGIDAYSYASTTMPNDTYSSLTGSFLSTFVMLTSENWPSIMLPPYKYSWANALYFIPSVVLLSEAGPVAWRLNGPCADQLALAVILGMVWATWETQYKRQVCRHYSKELRSYVLAWLAMIEVERLSQSTQTSQFDWEMAECSHRSWRDLIRGVGHKSSKHSHIHNTQTAKDPEVIRKSTDASSRFVFIDMWESMFQRRTDAEIERSWNTYADVTLSFRDDDTNDTINLCEFFSLCELLKFRVVPKPLYDRLGDSFHIHRLRVLLATAFAANFSLVWALIVAPVVIPLCCSWTHIVSSDHLVGEGLGWQYGLLIPVELVATLECIAVVLASGVHRSFASGHRFLDLLTLIFFLFGWIVLFCGIARPEETSAAGVAEQSVSCVAFWVFAHFLRLHIVFDYQTWDTPGCILYILSDLLLVRARNSMTLIEALWAITSQDGCRQTMPTRERLMQRFSETNLSRTSSWFKGTIEQEARDELVQDELEHHKDSLRSRVHLANRRIKEAFSRTFWLLFWALTLICLLMFLYAEIGHRAFGDAIEQAQAHYPDSQNVDTQVNTFATFNGSFLIVFSFIIDNNWNDVLYALIYKHPLSGPFYCISFFLIVDYIMLNIVTSIVLASFEKQDEYQLSDNREATCSFQGDQYVITLAHMQWHGLDLRITLLKEDKHELLSDFVNDETFNHIMSKTFDKELAAKRKALDLEVHSSSRRLGQRFSDTFNSTKLIKNSDLRQPLVESYFKEDFDNVL